MFCYRIPAPSGAGGPNQNTCVCGLAPTNTRVASINKLNPHFIYDCFLKATATIFGVTKLDSPPWPDFFIDRHREEAETDSESETQSEAEAEADATAVSAALTASCTAASTTTAPAAGTTTATATQFAFVVPIVPEPPVHLRVSSASTQTDSDLDFDRMGLLLASSCPSFALGRTLELSPGSWDMLDEVGLPSFVVRLLVPRRRCLRRARATY